MTRRAFDIGDDSEIRVGYKRQADHDNDADAATIRTLRPKRERIPDAWPRGMALEVAAAYVGVGESTWLREVAAGRAPKPIAITSGRRVWLREQLDAWLDKFDEAGRQGWREELENWRPSR